MKRIFILLALTFSIFLSACNNNDTDVTSISADEISHDDLLLYSSEELFDDIQYIYLAESYNNGFYVYASMKENPEDESLYYCDLSEGSINQLEYGIKDETPLISISSTSYGDLWVMQYVAVENDGFVEDGYTINILSGNGITEFEHEKISDSYPINMIVDDSNEKVYIYSSNAEEELDYIFVYSLDGQQLAKIKCTNTIENIVYSENEEKLFILENDDNNAIISVLDEGDNSINQVAQIELTTYSTMLYESNTYSYFININSVLMGFDYDTNTLVPIIDWLASGLSGYVRFVLPYNEDYISIRRETTTNVDIVELLSVTSELQSERETLKLATLESDEFTNAAVANFNKSNNEYYLEIIDYSIYGEDALQKLNTEIISGEIPDIFKMDGLPTEQYISRGVLEDLKPYMERDCDLGNFWESALSAIYSNNKCYLVVPGFTINTIIGHKEDITKIKNHNFSEILNYIDENSDEGQNVFGNSMTQLEFVEYIISCNMNQFVDYEAKECYFDSDEFIQLLNTACNLVPYDDFYDEMRMIYSGTQTISFQWIWYVSDMDVLSAVFKDDYETTSFYCNTDNSTGGAKMLPLYSYGMSASSEHKEGIWDFLKMLYSDDYQQLIMGGIPMSKTTFEVAWDSYKELIHEHEENGTTGITFLTIDGQELFVEFSEDRLSCYQDTIDLIDSIDSLYQEDERIMEIIYEEASACIIGDKSAEDTVAIIQNRIETYINEQS